MRGCFKFIEVPPMSRRMIASSLQTLSKLNATRCGLTVSVRGSSLQITFALEMAKPSQLIPSRCFPPRRGPR